jgi:hypothetical protein
VHWENTLPNAGISDPFFLWLLASRPHDLEVVAPHSLEFLRYQRGGKVEEVEQFVDRHNKPANEFRKRIANLVSLHRHVRAYGILLGNMAVMDQTSSLKLPKLATAQTSEFHNHHYSCLGISQLASQIRSM